MQVKTTKQGNIGVIEMNRPTKKNALTNQFALKLTKAIVDFNHDPEIVIIHIQSSTPGVFCVGADETYIDEISEYTFHENIKDSFDLMKLYKAIYLSPKITISEIDGHAISGGATLAMVTDFSFSTKKAKFGFTETKHGFIPAISSNFLKQKISLAQAKQLLFTGELISAKKAAKLGIITNYIKGDVKEHVKEFIKNLLNTNSHQSLLSLKLVFNKTEAMTLEDALSFSATMNAEARDSSDSKKGMDAFMLHENVKWSK